MVCALRVSEALQARGWDRLGDPSSTAFTLKWAETSKHINYKYRGLRNVDHTP